MDTALLLSAQEISWSVDRFSTIPETRDLLTAFMLQYNNTGRALRRLGLHLWGQQNLVLARDALLAAQSFDTGNSDLWRDLAGVYTGLGDTVHAEACLGEALSIDPANANAWIMMGEYQSKRGALAKAEYSYGQAIAIDPLLANAHFALGIVLFQQKKYPPSAIALQACLMLEPANAVAHLCLGHVLYLAGDFANSASAFAVADQHGMLDQAAKHKYIRARTLQMMIAGDIDQALDDYPSLAGADVEDIDIITRDAFSLLSAFGHLDAARAIGRKRLAQNPDDPTQRYLLDAVSGAAIVAAPLDYLEDYFDKFAPTFEDKLVNTLGYHVPSQLASMAGETQPRFNDALDLGCGTGLAGPHLKPFCSRITGVDISGGMLAQAGKLGIYDALVKADANTYLAAHHNSFNVIMAADFLIYFGDLNEVIARIHHCLKPGGIFAFSYEISEDNNYNILTSGRFAQSHEYVLSVMADRFAAVATKTVTIRLEANHPVAGRLIVARKLG